MTPSTRRKPAAVAIEFSANSKLSSPRGIGMSATYAAQQTCPRGCPLRRNGCYAEQGNARFTTNRLNKAGRRRTPLAIAQEEAAAILQLTGWRKLRAGVVGDTTTAAAARILASAMLAHEKKHNRPAWRFTHAWRKVARAAWGTARIIASCDRPGDVAKARRRGYAVAILTPPHPTRKVYTWEGLRILPCPAQFKAQDGSRALTCEDCRVCEQLETINERGYTLGFAPDANSGPRVLKVIQGGNC